MPRLLDQYGKPITVTKVALTEEVARPGMTGVRQAWSADTAVAGLTPDRLDAILRQANTGDMDAFLTLAEEMEERDPHYASVLQTRKLTVLGLDRKLTWSPGDEDHPRAGEILEACQKLVLATEMEDLLFHLMDAPAKGYAAAEVIWNTQRTPWTPASYQHRDPRWFQFDRETGRELKLREMGAFDGVALPLYRFVTHLAGRKSGLAARGGLARLVAFSFVCKLYGLKDWLAYAEIFGIPLRLGKYDASVTPEDVQVLKQAVFGLGSDAAAVIPQSMTIEFPELGKATGGAELFHTLVTFLDGQVSKAVLGQTGTTDMQAGGGFAQAKVLDGVRDDLAKADARALGATVTCGVLEPFVLFNFGGDAPVPRLELVVDEPEDVESLSTALERLVPLGLEVDQDEIRAKLRLSTPKAGATLLRPPAQAAAAVVDPDPAIDPKADPKSDPKVDPKVDPKTAPSSADLTQELQRAALARALEPADADDALSELQLAELETWDRTFGPEAKAVMDLVKDADSFEAVLAGLDAMAGDLAAPAAARSLARAMFQAAAIGDGQQRQGT